jgi:D-alanyl-D-alanine carboxypeptidase (penicillin-binding protein 5/6)
LFFFVKLSAIQNQLLLKDTYMKVKSLAKLISLTALVTLFCSNVLANPVIPIPTQPQQPSFTPSAPNLNATGFIMMDGTSGRTLAEKNSNQRMPPASLTKLMTMYIVSSALKGGQIKLDDKVLISKKAWQTEGSRMFVKVGAEVPVRDLVQGVVVASGNDAAVALAEHIAGTEEGFAEIMNQQAKILGMKDSHFVDSTGLPNENHYSTAHDLALLTIAYIKNFPEDYSLYSEKWFTYNNIKQPNRNRLLWRYQYADGLKTGHTKEAGYCLVGSAKKDGMRLITVVLGEPNDSGRTEDSMRLMAYGFRFFETHKLYEASKPLVQARVWQGQNGEVPLGLTEDFYVTVPTGQYKKLQASMQLNSPIKAPIIKGETYGNLVIKINDQVIATKPLIALDGDIKGGLIRSVTDSVKLNIHKYFSGGNETLNRS